MVASLDSGPQEAALPAKPPDRAIMPPSALEAADSDDNLERSLTAHALFFDILVRSPASETLASYAALRAFGFFTIIHSSCKTCSSVVQDTDML